MAGCDLDPDTMAEPADLAQAEAPAGVRVTGHACDVADEAQVLRFRDEVLAEHASDHVDLVFSNAGAGGGGGFAAGGREGWGRLLPLHRCGGFYRLRPVL